MKVLFFVTGVGYGDATREHANIEALLRKEPKAKVLIACYDNSYEYFKRKFRTFRIRGYRIPGSSMRFQVIPFVFNNVFLPFVWFFTAVKFSKAIKKFNPDIVVSDFEPDALTAAKLGGRKCVVVFGYDPEMLKDYSKSNKLSAKCWFEAKYFESLYDKADFVIIPKLLGVKRQSVLYHYVNPVIRKGPADFSAKNVLMQKLKLKRGPVVVMLGGSDFGLKLAKSLRKIASKFDDEFIVFGSHRQLEPAKNFRHIRFADNFLEYLKVSKGVITLGGQKMLTECLAFRKPMLVFPIQDHVEQLLNAYTMRDVAVIGKKGSGAGFEKEVRGFLRNLPKLQKKVDSMDIKFNGAEQVADLLVDLKKKISKSSARK